MIRLRICDNDKKYLGEGEYNRVPCVGEYIGVRYLGGKIIYPKVTTVILFDGGNAGIYVDIADEFQKD